MMLDAGAVQLAPGETHLKRPMVIQRGSMHVAIRGNPAGSTLVLDAGFKGKAAIVVDTAADVSLSGFEIRGNRTELRSGWYLPPVETPFADFYADNGIVIR